MKVAILLDGNAGPSAAQGLAGRLASETIGVGVGPRDDELRAAAAGQGIAQVLATIDPALREAGPGQSGHVLGALLREADIPLLLVDAEADRADGLLASTAAHHRGAAILLGALDVAPSDRPDSLQVTLALAGRRFRLEVTLPAVIVLAPTVEPTGAPTPALAPESVQIDRRDLAALKLRRQDLIEPSPPSTARPGQTRPTPVKDLSQLLD